MKRKSASSQADLFERYDPGILRDQNQMKQLAKKNTLASSHHQPSPSNVPTTGTSGIQDAGIGDLEESRLDL